MANLPEKNITTVDKITSIPSNTNLYINANGEFRQATIDDVLKASPVIADSITNQYKNASGSPILLTDSADGVAIDFDVKGRSTQDGEPTPTEPITPKSNGDMGYFDGELLSGLYNEGVHTANPHYVCSKNPIPCVSGDTIKLIYGGTARVINLLFFDENGAYLLTNNASNATEITRTVPTNASYFKFNVSESTTVAITPQTAKHICVTINGKYALIVDSIGKNKLNNTATTTTSNGVTFTVNDDESITIVGTPTANTSLDLNHYITLDVGDYIISGFPKGVSGRLTVVVDNVLYSSMSGSETEFNVANKGNYATLIVVSEGTTYNHTIYPMLRLASITDATYEPYKKSRKYIPISAPLRGLGEVTDVASLSECEVDRKFTKKVLNGSEDWSLKTIGCELYLDNTNSGNALCTHYKKNNGVSWGDLQDNEFNIIGTVLRIKDNTHQSTVDEWKTWLQANPITVIYELAEPTTESIEPIDVVTFEGVTHISVSDGADMEVEYPTSKVAGTASIGWSKGRRAEYDLEQLKVQMLALQTTIVSTV